MSRQASIPRNLESTIVRRWVAGASPRAIARWIEESNATRKRPVATSPSSVLRCIERASARRSDAACLASLHRLRQQTPAAVEAIGEADAGYRAVAARTNEPCKADVSRRLHVNLSALRHLELSAHRQLKASGVTGAFGEKLAADHKAVVEELARDIAAEDDLEDAGIAPEITVRHLPPELFPPAPLTPEIMAALRREQATLLATLSESKPLTSQPIDPPNRIASPTTTPAPTASFGAGTPVPSPAPSGTPTSTIQHSAGHLTATPPGAIFEPSATPIERAAEGLPQPHPSPSLAGPAIRDSGA